MVRERGEHVRVRGRRVERGVSALVGDVLVDLFEAGVEPWQLEAELRAQVGRRCVELRPLGRSHTWLSAGSSQLAARSW